MSSSTLTIIQTQLTLYGYPSFMILGFIGNVFIVIIFNRRHQNACSIYLISVAIMNILYLIASGFSQIFPFYYGNETIRAFVLCKIYYYTIIILSEVSRTMLVLACIDRFLITDQRASFRAFSTPKRAKYLILFSFIFWSLISIHAPIMATVINGQCNTSGIYSAILTVYTIIVLGLIPPITMGIFGYLTYRNMKQRHVRIQPVLHNTNHKNNISIQRRDRDLLILVISEVFAYVVTTAAFPLILLEAMISQYTIPNKSFQYLQIEYFILSIASLFLFINSAVPFYIYLISSKSFRQDFKQLIIQGYRKLRREPPVQIVSRTDQRITNQETRV